MNLAERISCLYDRYVYDWQDLLTGRWTRRNGWWVHHDPGPVWRSARSLADLGECTALWLEGRIAEQPGYGGQVDVDEDLAPGMTGALIAANRAGYVTVQSQGGSDRFGQQAAVIGLTTPDMAKWLAEAMPEPIRVAVWGRPPRDFREQRRWDLESGAVFGPEQIAGRSGLELWYAGCHPDALAEAFAAWQVAIWHPEVGPNDMWAALHEATTRFVIRES